MNGNGKKNLPALTNPAQKSNGLSVPSDRYPTDVNFVRWGVFASKNVRGYRTLPAIVEEINGVKVTRTVSVGTYKNTGETLNPDDDLVFRAIYGLWEKNGCKMEDRTLTSALLSSKSPLLLPGPIGVKSKRNPGARDYEKLRLCIDKLARISIEFDNAYEHNRGYSTEAIHILKKAEVFNRSENWGEHGEKGGKFFEFTTLELNEKICQNIKDGKIKLYYLDQLASIRDEAAKIIYNHMEFLGGVIKSPFLREALEFAKDMTIDIGPKGTTLSTKVILTKLRRACKELKGKILTHGVISDCYIDHDRERKKWFFVCHIRKVITIRAKKNNKGGDIRVPDRRDVDRESERVQIETTLATYDTLAPDDKAWVDKRTHEIYFKRYKRMGPITFAKLDAIEEHLGLKNLHGEVEEVKESTTQTVCERTRPENEVRPSFGSPAYVMLEVRALQKIRENWSVN